MKNLYTLLHCIFFALLLNTSYSQDPIAFGDFEEWVDITEDINADYSADFESETFVLPTELVPGFRLFIMLFDFELDLFFAMASQEDVSVDFLGIKRSTDSRTGDYALQMGGDTTVGFTDIIHLGEVNASEMPSSLSFYHKHQGTLGDTLLMAVVMGESGQALAGATSVEDPNVGAYCLLDTIYSGNDEIWNWTNISVVENDSEIALDSIYIIILRDGPLTRDQYILLDDMQWNITTPILDDQNNFVFQLGQSLNNTTIYPHLDHGNNRFTSYSIFDASGKLVNNSSVWKDNINVEHLSRGSYYFQIITENGVFAKPFVKH